MINVSDKQSYSRLKTLPGILQDALFSVQTAEIVNAVAAQNHLPAAKKSEVAKVLGYAILGFIHPEELADEIKEKAGVPQQTAKAIADSLFARILSPLKGELDKAYAPVPSEEETPQTAPKVFEEIKKPEGLPFVVPQAAPSAPVKPAEKTPIGEFARLGEGGRPSAPGAEAPITGRRLPAPEEPPPAIIHREESSAGPSKSESEFKIGAPTPKISEVKPDKSAFFRPAILELSGTPAPGASQPKPLAAAQGKPAAETRTGEKETARIVHYTPLKTPLEEIKMSRAAPSATNVNKPATAPPPIEPPISEKTRAGGIVPPFAPIPAAAESPKPPTPPQTKIRPPVSPEFQKNEPPPPAFQQPKIQPPPPPKIFDKNPRGQAIPVPPFPKKETAEIKPPLRAPAAGSTGPMGEFEKMKMLAKEWRGKAAPQAPPSAQAAQPKPKIEPPEIRRPMENEK